MIEIRTPGADDFEAIVRADARAFAYEWTPDDLEVEREVFDLSRYRIAVDRGQVVGVIGSDAFEMTLPGLRSIPMAGVTWVSVAVTHRRQGLLRRMMDVIHDDIAARGEPLAGLTSSEGGIYERFGYGAATQRRAISIERSRATFQPRFAAASGSLRIVEGDDVIDATLERWNRYRSGRPGEVTRTRAWQQRILHAIGKKAVCVVHDDGYVLWDIDADSNDGMPRHELRLRDFAAATPEAHLALWNTVLSVDLVGTIVTRVVPPDDPLPWLLTNPRVVRTTAMNDGVWLRPMDLRQCFAARRYAVDGAVVVEVDGRTLQIQGGPDGAETRSSRRRPDLVTDLAGAGSLLLGGVRPSELVARRRATVRNDADFGHLDAFFAATPVPHSTTSF